MIETLKDRKMARRKDKESPQGSHGSQGSPPEAEPVNVKVDRATHRKLKILAAAAETDLTVYVNQLLRSHVETEFPKFLREQRD